MPATARIRSEQNQELKTQSVSFLAWQRPSYLGCHLLVPRVHMNRQLERSFGWKSDLDLGISRGVLAATLNTFPKVLPYVVNKFLPCRSASHIFNFTEIEALH